MSRIGLRAALELVRAPATLSVPGDTMAGAALAGRSGTPGLAAASVLLYWAGMALNDWADRDIDAVERPERPIPSGRISANQALGIAAGLTGAGIAAATLAGGKKGFAISALLAGAVWAYDMGLKHTPAGPASMAACRTLDVMLGAGRATPMAFAVGAHTYGISILGRAEVSGASPATVRGALACTAAATGLAAVSVARGAGSAADKATAAALIAGYAASGGKATLALRGKPDPEQVRQAVRASIMGFVPLQSAAVAGGGKTLSGLGLLAALPVGRWLSSKMSTA
ncbi:4-hydroxybenzoate polyprenyltransferase [Herbidospora sp. NEAU-GS84]|uniref:4-hydroxybenzoate polyprenyltransferase n=1 Tax=Herbidospora solisilvae TaxID=2696284 RepID=A0A7C9J6W5_9ACTN|nr:UbiA family prenyltransferase [Herbidospora solisilvae]NAS26186.1 4-hydroxybenzoate polyprenyltransferase [Herbidospora solisilvae]